MRTRTNVLMLTALAVTAVPANPANALTCTGVVLTYCADSRGPYHTHSCSTSGTLRTCRVQWYGTSECSGPTPGTCTGTLNAGGDGVDTGACTYAALSGCTISLATARSVTFTAGTSRTSCATLTTTNSGLAGSASETHGPQCFTYS